MPTFLRYASCTVEGALADSVLALQEALSDRILTVVTTASSVASTMVSLDSTLRSPLHAALGSIFPLSPEQTGSLTCLPVVSTPSDIESQLRNRDGLNVVNGRVVINGDLDLTCLRTLTRVMGSYSAGVGVVGATQSGNFNMVVTSVMTTILPATPCTAESTSSVEEVIGVDTNINTLLSIHGLTFAQIKVYIFWLGFVNPTPNNFTRLLSLGLPSIYVPVVLTGNAQDNVQSCVLNDDRLLTLAAAYGADTDAIIADGPNTLNLTPAVSDLCASVGSAISRRRPGSTTPCGTRDFTDPASGVSNTLDLEKTFGTDAQITDCLSQATDPVTASIASLFQTIHNGIQTGLSSIQGSQLSLTQLSSLLSMVQSMIGENNVSLLACATSAVAGSANPSINPQLQQITGLLQNANSLFNQAIDGFQQTYNQLSALACSSSNLIGSSCSLNTQPTAPNTSGSQLSCTNLNLSNFGIKIPQCLKDICSIISQETSLIQSTSNLTLGNLQELRTLFDNLLQTMVSQYNVDVSTILRSGVGGPSLPGLPTGGSAFDNSSPACNPTQITSFFQTLAQDFGTGVASGGSSGT